MPMIWSDSEGNQWNCRITLEDNRRLKESGCDLFNAEVYEQVFGDAIAQLEFIAELLRPQWQQRGMTYEQFAEMLISVEGQLQLAAASTAEAIADFSRRLGKSAFATVVEMAWKMAGRVSEKQQAQANGKEMDNLIEAELAANEKRFQSAVEKAQQSIGAT